MGKRNFAKSIVEYCHGNKKITDYPDSVIEAFGIALDICVAVKVFVVIKCPTNNKYDRTFTQNSPYHDGSSYF